MYARTLNAVPAGVIFTGLVTFLLCAACDIIPAKRFPAAADEYPAPPVDTTGRGTVDCLLSSNLRCKLCCCRALRKDKLNFYCINMRSKSIITCSIFIRKSSFSLSKLYCKVKSFALFCINPSICSLYFCLASISA